MVREEAIAVVVDRVARGAGSAAAEARPMLDVVDGAVRRALRSGDPAARLPELAQDIARLALRSMGSRPRTRPARTATSLTERAALEMQRKDIDHDVRRLPDPDARVRLDALVLRAGEARDGLALWRVFTALSASGIDPSSRDDVRDLVAPHFERALHFGVPIDASLRLD
jgi:hypothetical protein